MHHHDAGKMVPLRPLDLRKCVSVSAMLDGMRYCAFNARNLGRVTETLTEWFSQDHRPMAIYDGPASDQVVNLLEKMMMCGFFRDVVRPEEFVRVSVAVPQAVVVGRLSPQFEEEIGKLIGRAIYINDSGYARKGQVRDGSYKDVVFLDPRLALPLIYEALKERLLGSRPMTISELVSLVLPRFGGAASELAWVCKTFLRMCKDKDCVRFLTMSGAMTIAKMGLVVCDLIDLGLVDFISSTGALVAHGTIEGIGLKHYEYDPKYSDQQLRRARLNRVTDTLEPEENFTQLMELVRETLDGMNPNVPISSVSFLRQIGKRLHRKYRSQRGVLLSAYRAGVPVMIPAFIDSELGNDVLAYNLEQARRRIKTFKFNPELDSLALIRASQKKKRIGIFSVGGGVPRNNVQNVAPLIEVINERLGRKQWEERQFTYGARICPDPAFYGHLSGCTYSENASWGKMNLSQGSFEEALTDATVGFPIAARFVMEQMGLMKC